MTLRGFFALCIRMVPWLVALGCFVLFCVSRWPISGVRTLSFSFDGRAPWFDTFLPSDRVSPPKVWENGWTGQRIFMEPVYATLRTPGAYERLRLVLEMRFWRQPLVELGMLRDPATFSFEMMPVWSEALSRGWREVTHAGLHGYVREDLPDTALVTTDIDHTLVWHATTTAVHAMDRGGREQSYDVSLRGGHDISAIPVDGEVTFTFLLQDMNRTTGQNTVALRLSREGETIWTNVLQTGGTQDQVATKVFETTVRVKSLPPAVYRLSITAGDDVFIRRITTNAAHWVLGPRLYVGDTVGYEKSYVPFPIWTNSQHLAAQTFHKEGLQTMTFGSATQVISETHRSYPLDRLTSERDGARVIKAPLGDIRIIGDGFFAFSPQALFLPSPRRLTDASDPIGEGIQAVITSYVAPARTEDGWWRIALDTRLTPGDDRPKISLSAPGILSREGTIDIRRAELIYKRQFASMEDWMVVLRAEARGIINRFSL